MTSTAPRASTPGAARSVDVAAERARTPVAVEAFSHTRFLNAAGAAIPTAATLNAVNEHLRLETEIGGYEAAAAVVARTEGVYDLAAALIGARPEQIALTESATIGWQRVIDAMRIGPGDRVLASRSTYVSSALQLLQLERDGVVVEVLAADDCGCVDLDALARALGRPAKLVTVAHVPTSSGMVEPVAEIGGLARAAGVPFVLDATQSAGQIPIDVGAFACDALIFTGRKFVRGPRGTGVLFVGDELCERLAPVAPDVRGAHWTAEHAFEISGTASRFETWEASHALRLGLGVAIAEVLALGVETIGTHVIALSQRLRTRLQEEVPQVRIADLGEAPSGIVTFVRRDEPADATLARLREHGCYAATVPVHHGVWDMRPRGLDAVVRASFHVYNDEADVEALVEAVAVKSAATAATTRAATPATTRAAATSAPELPAARSPTAAAAAHFKAPWVGAADTIVIGAGVHGRSAAWNLARRGASVILLEQFRTDHLQGSSHGATRMIRRAYPAAVWDDFLDRAFTGWVEIEALAGARLIETTGGIYAHPHGEGNLCGPGVQQIDVAQARELSPSLVLADGFEVVSDGFDVVYDPAAGVIDAAGAMSTFLRLAVEAGAAVHDSTPVLAIRDDADGVTVTTPQGDFRAKSAVVAAGSWTAQLLPEYANKLEVIRIVNVHFQAPDVERVSAPELSVFAVQVPGVGLLYGLPAIWGRGLKVGLDDGPRDDPARQPAPVNDCEVATLRELVTRFVPAGAGPVEATVACRYTRSGNQRFALGPVPERPRVLVAAACSGHGFKFAPAVGAALADMAEGIVRPDLEFIAPGALPDLGALAGTP